MFVDIECALIYNLYQMLEVSVTINSPASVFGAHYWARAGIYVDISAALVFTC